MWVVFDTCGLLDLVERDQAARNALTGRIRYFWETWKSENTNNTNPIRLWFPPITVGEAALLQFPSYRTSRWRDEGRLTDDELTRLVNVAYEAIRLLDPAVRGNLQRRLPGLDFELVVGEPAGAVSRLAMRYFADHRKNPAYLHCERGRVKSLGDTADQLAFEFALAVAQSTETTTVFVTSDYGLLATLQGLGVDRHRVKILDSKVRHLRLQGPDAEPMDIQCIRNENVCQGVRTGAHVPCQKWPQSLVF